MSADPEKAGDERGDLFGETNWTSIGVARQQASAQARQALEELCQKYWYPLYAYIRHRGHNPEDAQDLTQAFFCEFLEKDLLSQVDRRKGKFRAYLLACLNLFLSNDRKHGRAQKRGGGQWALSLEQMGAEERYQCEPLADESPEFVFDRQWARTLLQQARTRLRDDYEKAGKGKLFEQIQPYLTAESSAEHYQKDAATLGMTPGAVSVAVHRLRSRFGEIVRDEVSRTVGIEEDAESECQYLQKILAQPSNTSFTGRKQS